jgi:hypothetical protein
VTSAREQVLAANPNIELFVEKDHEAQLERVVHQARFILPDEDDKVLARGWGGAVSGHDFFIWRQEALECLKDRTGPIHWESSN